MSRLLKLSSALFTTCLSLETSLAAPMSPDSKKYPGIFSVDVTQGFELYADSDDPSIVYYVPKEGSLLIRGARSRQPAPAFSASSFIPQRGIWAGSEITSAGGTFLTSGGRGLLQMLLSESKAQGLNARPAPVSGGNIEWILHGAETDVNGRIVTNCIKEEWTNTRGQSFTTPVCDITIQDGSKVRSDYVYRFSGGRIGRNSSVIRPIPFQASFLPDIRQLIEEKLIAGAGWEDLISAQVRWNIIGESKTRKAVINVNWKQLFERAEAFASYHNNACVDIQLQSFWQKEVSCTKDNMDNCSIDITFYDDKNKPVDSFPNDVGFINAVNKVKDKLQAEIFAKVAPKLDRISTKQDAQYILRANYQKISLNRNEKHVIYYNAGTKELRPETVLNIFCVRSDFLGSKIYWDIDSPDCTDYLGQQELVSGL